MILFENDIKKPPFSTVAFLISWLDLMPLIAYETGAKILIKLTLDCVNKVPLF